MARKAPSTAMAKKSGQWLVKPLMQNSAPFFSSTRFRQGMRPRLERVDYPTLMPFISPHSAACSVRSHPTVTLRAAIAEESS